MSSRTKAVLVVAVAFMAGLFVGVAGDRALLIHNGRLFPRRGAAFAAKHVVDHLDRQLHLSDAQKTQIQRIVDAHHTRIQSIWDNVRPQVRREIDAASAEIESVLTPQQRTTYRDMRNRQQQGHHRRGMLPF